MRQSYPRHDSHPMTPRPTQPQKPANPDRQRGRSAMRERFERFVEPEPNSGCHIWTGALKSDGYGVFGVGESRTKLAHRVAWELDGGTLSDSDCVLHRCDNPACVNVSHLFVGDRGVNLRDMARKGRGTKSAAGLPFGVARVNGKFMAQLNHCGKYLYLGCYDTAEQAGSVAANKKLELLGPC